MDGIQLSMFDMQDPDQDELRTVLRRGSGYEGGRLRIYAAWNILDNDRFISFLADEFGVGGHSIEKGFCDYNGKNLLIRHWKEDRERRYSWRQIAKEYDQMIRTGDFPDRKTVELYQAARDAGMGAPRPRIHYYGE